MEHLGLRDAGLKVTQARLKILRILENAPKPHMSAEAVYQALLAQGEEVGLATVYRVLTQFSVAGLVKRLSFDSDHAIFELERGEHHDHMLCMDCGNVVEFVDAQIEERQKSISKQHGFTLVDHSLMLYGKCASCANRKEQRVKTSGSK